MPTIVSIPQLEVWVQATPGSLAEDTFALSVVEEASGLVCDTAKHPEWEDDITLAPRAAKRIALMVAKRTYENPGAVVAEGGIGPIGGDRVLDTQAMGLMLTEAEEEILEDLRGDGTTSNDFWVQPIGGGAGVDQTGYVFDSSGSDWAIPYVDFNSTDAMTEPADTIV